MQLIQHPQQSACQLLTLCVAGRLRSERQQPRKICHRVAHYASLEGETSSAVLDHRRQAIGTRLERQRYVQRIGRAGASVAILMQLYPVEPHRQAIIGTTTQHHVGSRLAVDRRGEHHHGIVSTDAKSIDVDYRRAIGDHVLPNLAGDRLRGVRFAWIDGWGGIARPIVVAERAHHLPGLLASYLQLLGRSDFKGVCRRKQGRALGTRPQFEAQQPVAQFAQRSFF